MSAASAACTGKARETRGGRAPCAEPRKADTRTFEPYDPARARAGRSGVIDLGGGSEVRIGGRTSLDYTYTR